MTSPQPDRCPAPAGEGLGDAELTRQIEALRPALRGYILSILPHPDSAEDVVQETCLFLWERRADFKPGTSFKAWAFKTGYFKALSQRRDLQRRKVITLSEDLIHRIAAAAEERAETPDERLAAMFSCLGELRPRERRGKPAIHGPGGTHHRTHGRPLDLRRPPRPARPLRFPWPARHRVGSRRDHLRQRRPAHPRRPRPF